MSGKFSRSKNRRNNSINIATVQHVDEVIIGAPYIVDSGLISGQNISIVFCGTERDFPDEGEVDPYMVARDAGILQVLESPSKVTTTSIIDKILANSASFRERNRKKQAKERAAVQNSTS